MAAGVLLALGAALLFAGSAIRPTASDLRAATPKLDSLQPVTQPRVSAANFDRLPLIFEENRGQVADQVRFLARGVGYGLFLTQSEAVLRLSAGQGSVLRMGLANASMHSDVTGEESLPGKSHYLLGNDPSKWHRDVPQFARVHYSDVYPGIGLTYYGNQGKLEYDFEVAPGANPENIGLNFQGSSNSPENPSLAANGDLLLSAQGSDVRLHAPRVYQDFGGQQQDVPAKFVERADGSIGFSVGNYDRSRELIIDPILTYSTYLGGTGAESCSTITGKPFTPRCPAIAVDTALSLYIAGSTTSTDFPVAASATEPVLHGTANVFVSKFNSTGTALLFNGPQSCGNARICHQAWPQRFELTVFHVSLGQRHRHSRRHRD
jgi:hypothetical protein